MRPDDESFTGLDTAHRGSRPRGGGGRGGGAIYHMAVRNGSRAKNTCARAAAAYIQREAEYSRGAQAADLVYTESGHMPAWAAAEPTSYWHAADLWERRNGQLFKGVEVALPLALTPAERQELAVGFAHHLTDAERLPYTLAIHAGNGDNPHCHVLISERGNDGVERDEEQWFKRYNAEHPELGGARKSRALQPKSWLLETRAAWAAQTNHALERAGHEIRIDDRSLEAQGIERLPTLHRGPRVQAMEAREIETDRGKEARAVARANVELADMAAAQAQLAARLAVLERRKAAETAAAPDQEPPPRPLPARRWETVKARVGAWFSREPAPEARPTPEAAPDAPSPAQDGPRPSSPVPDQAGAENAPERPVSVAEEYRQRGRAEYEARKRAAYVLEHYEEVAAQVAAIEDPAQRAEAERHLETIRQEEADRQRRQEREQERGRGRDEDFDLEP